MFESIFLISKWHRCLTLASLIVAGGLGCLVAASSCSIGLADDPATSKPELSRSDAVFAIVWMGDRTAERSDSGNQQIRTQLMQIRRAGYRATLISHDVDRHDLAAFDVVVLPSSWDAWTSVNKQKSELLKSRGDEFRSFINAGGILWMMQPNPYLQTDSQCSPTLAPYSITFRNAFQTTDSRVIEMRNHPLVIGKTANADWLPQHYDTVIDLDEKWDVIASSDGHPSILEAEYGSGLCFITPSSPNRFSEEFCNRACRYLARRSRAPLSVALQTNRLPPPTDAPPVESVANLTLESLQSRRECESALIAKGTDALPAIAAVAKGAPTVEVDVKEIEKLVVKLGHSTFHVRQNAYIQLQRLGHIALPALRQGEQSNTREVAYRCQLLVARLTNENRATSLGDEKESERPRSMIRVLSAINNPDARELLERLSRSKSIVVARLAQHALRAD